MSRIARNATQWGVDLNGWAGAPFQYSLFAALDATKHEHLANDHKVLRSSVTDKGIRILPPGSADIRVQGNLYIPGGYLQPYPDNDKTWNAVYGGPVLATNACGMFRAPFSSVDQWNQDQNGNYVGWRGVVLFRNGPDEWFCQAFIISPNESSYPFHTRVIVHCRRLPGANGPWGTYDFHDRNYTDAGDGHNDYPDGDTISAITVSKP